MSQNNANTEATTKEAIEVSRDEWERYGADLWSFIENLADVVHESADEHDDSDRGAIYLIGSTKQAMADAFPDDTGGLANQSEWTKAEVDLYESVFEPFFVFVGMMRDRWESDPLAGRIIALSMPAYYLAKDGIVLFRSRLAQREGGAR